MKKFDLKSLTAAKVIRVFSIIALIYAVLLSSFLYFQPQKIGYIDTQVLMEKHPAAVKAKADFEAKTNEWRNNIQTLENELTKLNKEMIELGGSWPKQELMNRQNLLKQKQADYNRYRTAVEQKALQTEKEIMQPVFSGINAKIESFGKDKGMDLILGTLAAGSILYAHKSKDFTEEFLEYAKKK